jgi:hypothetical protein
MLINAIIFLALRYLCKWINMEGLADTLQGFVDTMLNGTSPVNVSSGPIGSNNFGPQPVPNVGSNPTPGLNIPTSDAGNPLNGISDFFGKLMEGKDLTNGIAKLGTLFSSKLQSTNAAAPAPTRTSSTSQDTQKPKKPKKSLFSE